MKLRLVLPVLLGIALSAASPAVAATRPDSVAQLRKQLVQVTRERDAATTRLVRANAALAAMTTRRNSWRADAAAVNDKLLTALHAYTAEDSALTAASSALTASAETQVGAMAAGQLFQVIIAINARFLAVPDPNYSVTSSIQLATSTYQFDFHPTPPWAVR